MSSLDCARENGALFESRVTKVLVKNAQGVREATVF